MDSSTLSTLKELGIGMVGMLGAFYLLYRVLMSQQKSNDEKETWFKGFVEENNHKVTDLVAEVSRNIAMNTESNKQFVETLENHTKVVEKLVNKLDK